MAIEHLSASRTSRLPLPDRHRGRIVTGPGGTSQFKTFRLPNIVMTMTRSNQGMGNLVQNGVANMMNRVSRHVVFGQFYRLHMLSADTQTPFVPVE